MIQIIAYVHKQWQVLTELVTLPLTLPHKAGLAVVRELLNSWVIYANVHKDVNYFILDTNFINFGNMSKYFLKCHK